MRIGTSATTGRLLYSADGSHWREDDDGAGVAPVVSGSRPLPSRGAAVDDPHFAAPFRPGKIIGVGLNFLSTIEQMGFPVPAEPYLFAKYSSSVTGPTGEIAFDTGLTTRVDWEGELAVVIGRTARNIDAADALQHVWGYTVANDVSARDLQERDPQWVRGKGLDTFCPLGPVIVSADEFPDPQVLTIRTWVNGELVQDGSTADMLFSVADLISHFSHSFTLEPGDVILTGTPPGCGDFMTPRRSLHDGDLVEVEIDGIGRLSNPVRTFGARTTESEDRA